MLHSDTPTASVQPVRATAVEVSRACASVRPMAVSPAQTPTATVMPTVTPHEGMYVSAT